MHAVFNTQELHSHVEVGLGRNLQNRCSSALKSAVEVASCDITGLFVMNSVIQRQLLNGEFHDDVLYYVHRQTVVYTK